MSAQNPSHKFKGVVCRALRQDCVEAQIGGRVQKMSAALKVPKNSGLHLFLNGEVWNHQDSS
jgi:hypothetical protein